MSNTKKAPTGAAKKAAQAKGDGVGALARKLLVETDQGYPEIVEAIRAKFPEAKTTARSVASIACNLRKSGVDVPMRRASKKEA
jgi:hypothetical protein